MSYRWMAVGLTMAACTSPRDTAVTAEIGSPSACDYPQIYGTADHSGRACPEINNMVKVAEIVQDADANAEIESNGFLQVHESPAVTLGDFVVVPTKDGFTDVFNEQTTRYHVTTYKWVPSVTAANAKLVHQWDADSDFQTVDAAVCSFGCMTNGYVQQFAALIATGAGTAPSVYMPAAHGQFLRFDLATGALQARIDPFAGTTIDGDSRLIVNNAPMTTPDGSVLYTATAWPLGPNPFGAQPRGSWLVKLFANNSSRVVDWSPDNAIKLGGTPIANPSIGVPVSADNTCEIPFGTRGTPAATGPDSKPQLGLCFTQRPALNAPLAYSSVTNHYVGYSYSNNTRGVAFLIEIDADSLAPIRSADMRKNHLRYGCGVRLDVTFPGCSVVTAGGTTNLGVDPSFNGDIHYRTPLDIMDNPPTISPDGLLWTIGGYDGGFSFEGVGGYDARGSMVSFNSDGTFASNNPDFGWEVAAAAVPFFGTALPDASATGTFPIGFNWAQDRGLYSLGHLGLALYDRNFQLQNVGELPNVLFGDFVDVNITFGPRGDHYGASENGNFYKLDSRGNLVDVVQLTAVPIEVLSGTTARDRAGRAYVSYAGKIHVIQSGGTPPVSLAAKLAAAPRPTRTTQRAAIRKAGEAPEPGSPD